MDELTYESFLKSRDFLSGSIFTIKAWSHKRDIFPNLEKGFIKIFANDFSKSLKARRDSTVNIEIQNLSQELSRIDTIQKTYLEVIKNESQNSKLSFDIGSMIPIQEDKTVTKEFDFFIREQQIRSSLGELKQELIEGNTIYDVVSGFDNIGSKDQSVRQKLYSLIAFISVGDFLFSIFWCKSF